MPRKKRERNRGRIIRQEMQDKFLNQWTNNQENSYDLKTVSIIFRNENDCLFQILLSEDHIFNGIFLITTYKFSKEEDGTYMLTIEDLEDIHNPRLNTFKEFCEELPQLFDKYKVIVPEEFTYHPTDEPLSKIKTYNKLIMG